MSFERSSSGAGEDFIAIERMEQLVRLSLERAGRINRAGEVNPVTIERWTQDLQTGVIIFDVPPTIADGFLIPDETVKKTADAGYIHSDNPDMPSLVRCLYSALVDKREIHVSQSDCSRLESDQQSLEDILMTSKRYDAALLHHQSQVAYHIDHRNAPVADIASTRVYVPAGIDAMRLVGDVIEAGADMNFVKAWVPEPVAGLQKFRSDTPLFQVRTKNQLRSLLGALREVMPDSVIDLSETPSLVGVALPDFPAVYVGQVEQNFSFNQAMATLFGEPIRQACLARNLPTGELIGSDWLRDVALTARSIAQTRARYDGINPFNHALLNNQDDIMGIITTA